MRQLGSRKPLLRFASVFRFRHHCRQPQLVPGLCRSDGPRSEVPYAGLVGDGAYKSPLKRSFDANQSVPVFRNTLVGQTAASRLHRPTCLPQLSTPTAREAQTHPRRPQIQRTKPRLWVAIALDLRRGKKEICLRAIEVVAVAFDLTPFQLLSRL